MTIAGPVAAAVLARQAETESVRSLEARGLVRLALRVMAAMVVSVTSRARKSVMVAAVAAAKVTLTPVGPAETAETAVAEQAAAQGVIVRARLVKTALTGLAVEVEEAQASSTIMSIAAETGARAL